MFISFGMYILLIIATIVMIGLIIYLTMTTGKNDTKHSKKYTAEKAAHAHLAQQQASLTTSPFGQEDSITDKSYLPSDQVEQPITNNVSTQQEHLEDPLLQVLPYPKDNNPH